MTTRMLTTLALLSTVLSAAASTTHAAQPTAVASDPADRTGLELTVYNSDLALVRETRTVELPSGEGSLEFRGVPSRIEPRSLIVDHSGGKPFRLLEQSYEFDLMSRKRILEKYVGRELTWIQEDGRRVTGTLLGMAEGPVFRVDGEIVFEVEGRLALPSLPDDLRARPTLVWRTRADRAGERDLDVSYLSGGLSWSADYVMQLDDAGERAEVQAWVSVENRSGATFRDAGLMLLAGDVNRVREQRRRGDYKLAVEAMAVMADGVAEESVGDYHLYTMPERTTLKDNEIKQLSMFTAAGVPVTRHYRLDGRGGYRSTGDSGRPLEKISVVHEVRNTADDGLGIPLPSGVVRLYGRSSSGSRQLLGEARIDHTPRDESLWLHTGSAFDLVAERTRVSHRKRGDRTWDTEWRIELRNRSDRDVVIEVFESLGGEWTILHSSHDPRQLDAHRVRFDVSVPAGGTVPLTYGCRVSS